MKNLLLGILTLLIFDLITQAQNNIISGELIVMLNHGESAEATLNEINQHHPNFKLTTDHALSNTINLWLMTFDDAQISNDNALSIVTNHNNVALAQFNHSDIKLRALPNDPQVSQQWAFNNTGTTGVGGNASISAQAAWDITTSGTTVQGDQLVVAVIDGSFFINHEDINFWSNTKEIPGNNIDDDNNGYVDDVNGWNTYNNSGNITSGNHGTHVAGTVAANGNNGIGVTGVNWDAEVMAIQGSSGNEATVVAAYGYALDNRVLYDQSGGTAGAFVVSTNASFGVDFGNPANYPIWCSIYDTLGTYGIISCGATANNNVNIDAVGDIPTACPSDYLISVTNTNSSDIRSFAGYGLTTIDLAAPGTGILSTYPNNNYQSISGTSMATPHVAGSIALMLSAGCSDFITAYKTHPDSMALVIRNMLLSNIDPVPNLANECVTGGRLNLHKAVLAVANFNCSPMTFVTSHVDATCGNNNGSASVNVSGNVGSVTYSWDDLSGQTTPTANNLAAGNYSVTMTDSVGNVNVLQFTILNSNEPALATSEINPISCNGDQDGSVTVNITGGTPSFSYQWNDANSQTTQTATGLGHGTYIITVTDSANCVVSDTITITQPFQLGLSFSILGNTTSPSNGQITINGYGGTPPYSYLWSSGETTNVLSDLYQGNYVVTITDDNNCVRTDTLIVPGNVSLDDIFKTKILGSIYPNPNNGSFVFNLVNASGNTFELEITNAIGQKIDSKIVVVNHDDLNIPFDSENLTKGIYFLNVTQQGKLLGSFKVLVEK